MTNKLFLKFCRVENAPTLVVVCALLDVFACFFFPQWIYDCDLIL